MRIESALYSSREGLSVNGQAISVLGDNISNANTTGFKAARTEFADLLDVGSGVMVQQVRNMHQTGFIETTERNLDVAISGNGFFMVGDAESPFYSRAGNFSLSADGLLVDGNGKSVLGYTGDAGTTLGTLNFKNVASAAVPTSETSLAGNLSSVGDVKTAPTAPASYVELNQLSDYTHSSSVFDSLGEERSVTLAFTKTGVNAWTVQAYIDGGDVGGTEGVPQQVGSNLTLSFNSSGLIEEANKAAAKLVIAPQYAGGAAAGNISIDLSSMTQFAVASQITAYSQNGVPKGDVQDYRFDEDGKVYAVLSGGADTLIGRIGVATFPNVDGLERIGNNLFAATESAGDVAIAVAGEDGTGVVKGGSLEQSTVDLAESFVELVVLQRGYRANSQTLSATNDLLRETIALIR